MTDSNSQNDRLDHIGRSAAALAHAATELAACVQEISADALPGFRHRRYAQGLYDARRLRDTHFDDASLFGEPAWDILLDIFAAEQAGKSISITSACIAAAVPPTTGLRWISVLIDRGYLARTDDTLDTRRRILSLTDHSRQIMIRYFKALEVRYELLAAEKSR